MPTHKNIHRYSTFLKGALLLFLSFCCIIANAQRVPFYNLNIENGLIQSQAMCLAQDKLGYLWIGTVGGLSRYDGNSFLNFSVRNGLAGNAVNSIAIDEKNRVWAGTANGISVMDGGKFQNIALPGGNHSAMPVKTLEMGAKGVIWCLAKGRIFRIEQMKPQELPLPSAQIVASAIETDSNRLWVGSQGKVLRYENNKWDSLSFPIRADNVSPFVIKFYKDKSRNMWLLTNAGLYRVENNAIILQTLGNRPLDYLPPLLCMAEDNHQDYWLGTNSGVLRIRDTSILYYNKKNGLSDNSFYDILNDKEGNIWLASDGQGVFRFSGTMFTGLDESVGLPSAQIMSIAASKNGILYLGTYDAGLYAYQDGVAGAVILPGNLKPMITSLAVRNGYQLWIGTKGYGLWRYDHRGFKSYTAPARHFPSNMITTLYNDSIGRFWIGFSNGVVMLNKDTFRAVPVNGISVDAFLQIGPDSILMATMEGLKLYSAGTVTPFITHKAPDSSVAQCFTMRGRELWIGTSDNGIISYNLNTGESHNYNRSNGLQSDFIYNIITDNDGNVWAGTGYGIHKISFAEGKPVFYFYGKGQGVTGMESNHNAVLKMNDGSIWFGTTNGALHYQPNSRVVNAQAVGIVMQGVKLFGENITNPDYYDSLDNWYGVPYHLRLPYQKNNITFSFHAISLSSGGQLLYRYRIDGLDAPWSDWSATNSVTYSALPPGNYTFRVQCATDNGTIKELKYPFVIITPFQKTNLFKLLVLAGCILLGISLQYIANRMKQRRLRLLEKLRIEEQNKVRQRTAEDFHDEVGNKLTRINVLTNVLKTKIGTLTPESERIITQIQDNTSQLYSGTRDILWSLKPSNDNLYEIINRIRDFGVDLFQDTEVQFVFEGLDDRMKKFKLPLDVSRNLIMIFKEAMNNSLKYADASEVKLTVSLRQRNVLQLILSDNGKGFDMRYIKKGHGINNMTLRAGRIHGRLYIDSMDDKGTMITLTFKIPQMK